MVFDKGASSLGLTVPMYLAGRDYYSQQSQLKIITVIKNAAQLRRVLWSLTIIYHNRLDFIAASFA